MKTKLIVGGAAVVVALVLSVLAFTRPGTVERVLEVGSASSPSVTDGCMQVNGLTTCYFSSPLRSSTSTAITNATMCSYKVLATSTLVAANLRLKNAAYSNTFEIGIGTDGFSTTTRLGIKTIASSEYGEVVASTTDSITGMSGNVLIPGNHINFKVATGTPAASWAPKGACSVEVRNL